MLKRFFTCSNVMNRMLSHNTCLCVLLTLISYCQITIQFLFLICFKQRSLAGKIHYNFLTGLANWVCPNYNLPRSNSLYSLLLSRFHRSISRSMSLFTRRAARASSSIQQANESIANKQSEYSRAHTHTHRRVKNKYSPRP